MPQSRPYQPLLLRLLHGANAAIAFLSILSAFIVYNTYDGRFGKVPVPRIADIIGIHGTFGKLLLLGVMPAFALYSFHAGQRRLVQQDSFAKLAQLGKPIWWYSLHRIVNTLMLLALTFAIASGSMVKEEWLPAGDLTQVWYYLHLSGWVVLVFCLLIHLLMSAKVGGWPLILSMFDRKYRPEDSPAVWWRKIRSFVDRS
ncbi:cytochrome b/b6 domain-containing protein [Microcoleus sp. PH2017_28_MFU_U_A]|uniref:cytochrome b/b6 domain-containing protein n=1 Tax=Microcoleus sp. PH2017_28_MFU_U_A TaxID=2798838 RepID=UPI001DB6A686|nr:cytochrome b/b6 domain-containing protein [Microcoleus sp. PH2017_28_MFU_U_A]MCC3589765.1 cytochrome b/b6 domain-containing protein [Microcoleus sp. PH2017_28_MFU_U_A]TAE12611.1 MAG: cytochrome b/b6 domain-containing protein [Oscillatoriales cyanobacterium]TAE24666.1 MAG: cytochrome b/b6 domain-containing protein [Oscillatoriales cyanobacterium]TAE53680.1 MAG: cytochrome b/b6 domain-containing protein [Oscillatoriales cyanobacterium]